MASLKSILTRETSGQKLIPQIDGLRFVAIASVVGYHINSFVISKSSFYENADAKSDLVCIFLSEGHVGVQLFFVISGFILGLPFARQHIKSGSRVSLKKYFLRRLIRLEPPYLMAMTTAMVALVLIKGQQLLELIPHFIASVFYVHYFIYGSGSELIAAAWSLEIEVQFYVLAPLLGCVYAIPSKLIRRLILVAAIIVCGAFQSGVDYPVHSPMHGWTILSALHWFLTGLLLADLYVVGDLERGKKPYAWDLAGLASWIAIWGCVYLRFQIHVIIPFLILIAYIAAFKGSLFKRLLSVSWIYIIGGMCYTIYLYHGLIKSVVGKQTTATQLSSTLGGEVVVQCVLISAAIFLVCSFLFVVAEKPFMSRKLFERFMSALSFSKTK